MYVSGGMKIAVFWTLFVPQVGWVFLLVSRVRLLSFLVRVWAMLLTPGILARYPLVVVPFGSSVSAPVFRCRTVYSRSQVGFSRSVHRTYPLPFFYPCFAEVTPLSSLHYPLFIIRYTCPYASSFVAFRVGFVRSSPSLPLPHILALLNRPS